jgi:uncharacterized membrane protein (DUF2068 family)
MSTQRAIRTIAIIEAAKGALVLLAGFGLLSLVHHDMEKSAEVLLARFSLNPASHYPHIFLDVVQHTSNARLRGLAALALLYASIRFGEGYGLWHGRRWAAWFGALSSGIYIPVELYEILHGIDWIKTMTLLINLAVFSYLAYILWHTKNIDPRSADKA